MPLLFLNLALASNSTNATDNNESVNITILPVCNISVNITSSKTIYTDEKITFYNKISNNSFPYKIEYWIEDLFGDIIKSKRNTTNTNQKSFSPSYTELDQVLILKNKLVFINCTNINIDSIFAEKLVIAAKNSSETDTTASDSSINITHINLGSDNKAEFGDIIKVELSVYRGDTLKRTVKAWVEDSHGKKASSETPLTIATKFTGYSLTLPIQLKSNCDNKLSQGTFTLTVEGLDIAKTESITIEGNSSLCKTKTIKEEKIVTKTETVTKEVKVYVNPKKRKFIFDLVEKPYALFSNKPFSLTINLTNNDIQDYSLLISSYVYQHSKVYSKNRTANQIAVKLRKNSSSLVYLSDNTNAPQGLYNIKVKMLKSGVKTPYEITDKIFIIHNQTKTCNTTKTSTPSQASFSKTEKTPLESKKLAPYLMILVSAMFNIFLIWRVL